MGYDKAKLADSLRLIFEHAGPQPPPGARQFHFLPGDDAQVTTQRPGEAPTKHIMVPGSGATVFIWDQGISALAAFASEACSDALIAEEVGESGVRSAVCKLLQSTAAKLPGEPVEDVVRFRILKPLREAVHEWTSYLGVPNLLVDGEVDLGCCKLVRKDAVDEIWQALANAPPPPGAAESAEPAKPQDTSAYKAMLGDTPVVAAVKVRCHSEALFERAMWTASNGINTLRAFMRCFHDPSDRIGFSLVPEGRAAMAAVASSKGSPLELVDISLRNLGIQPFHLSSERLDHLKSMGFSEAVSILAMKAGERSSLDSAIVQALQAMGRAWMMPTVDQVFLHYFIAIERLLVHDGDTSTTEKLADRLALTIGIDKDARVYIHREAKRLYEARSNLVHAAKFDVSKADCSLISEWAITLGAQALQSASRLRGEKKNAHMHYCGQINERKFG